MLNRIGWWISDYAMQLMIALVLLAMILFVVLHEPAKYHEVPVEFCREALTGAQMDEQVPVQNCASYDKNGVCTVPFTTYYTQTKVQVRISCDYTEWRTR